MKEQNKAGKLKLGLGGTRLSLWNGGRHSITSASQFCK